jgi:hypothetical protein
MEIDIFEVEYSVSPGGVDCWEAEVRGYGQTTNYSEYKTAGEALNHMLSLYGDNELNVNVISLTAYAKLEEGAYG